MSTGATASFEQCPNCGADHPGRYCSACGQKSTPLNPSMRDFFHELTHEVLHLDGKIFRSLRLLATVPGELTRQHFQGRRTSYVSATRLYLTFSVLYFAIAAYAPGLNLRVTVGATNQSGWTWSGDNQPRSSDVEELRRLGFESEGELEQAVSDTSARWVPRIMFLLVPVFAGLAKLVTRHSGRNFPQYLYFALHVHAAWFLALAINAAGGLILNRSPAALSAATLLYMALYLAVAMGRAFGTGAMGALWRGAIVGTSYAVLVIVAVAGVILPLVLTRR